MNLAAVYKWAPEKEVVPAKASRAKGKTVFAAVPTDYPVGRLITLKVETVFTIFGNHPNRIIL